MTRIIKIAALGLAAATAMAGTASAGGFDRGGVNIDLLYSQERIASEAGVTHVMPQRTIENVTRGGNEAIPAGVVGALIAGAPGNGFVPTSMNPTVVQQQAQAFLANPANAATAQGLTLAVSGNAAFAPQTAQSIAVDSDYTVPRLGFKMNLTEQAACLGTYTEPFGADANYGLNNAYSPSTVAFAIDTRDYGLTCSYQFMGPELGIGQSYFRVIGGVSYQELEGFQSRQRFLDFANAGIGSVGGVTNTAGVGTFNIEGDAIGFRIGGAFEVPDIALRAEIIYHSKYDYDDLTGFQDNRGFGAAIPGSMLVPITASAEIPQALEFKVQSGIAPGTLAFLNVKWQDWSQLGIIPIQGGRSPVDGQPTNLSFDPLYQDGWTVTAGVGRQFTDMVAATAAITWDRGTSTISGTQTDTWTFGGGVSIEPNENVELRLGGAVGILTSGTSTPAAGGDAANNVTYSFGSDTVTAVSGALRVKF